jgi:hypothetical protein
MIGRRPAAFLQIARRASQHKVPHTIEAWTAPTAGVHPPEREDVIDVNIWSEVSEGLMAVETTSVLEADNRRTSRTRNSTSAGKTSVIVCSSPFRQWLKDAAVDVPGRARDVSGLRAAATGYVPHARVAAF